MKTKTIKIKDLKPYENNANVIANNKKTVVCPFCDCAFEIKE